MTKNNLTWPDKGTQICDSLFPLILYFQNFDNCSIWLHPNLNSTLQISRVTIWYRGGARDNRQWLEKNSQSRLFPILLSPQWQLLSLDTVKIGTLLHFCFSILYCLQLQEFLPHSGDFPSPWQSSGMTAFFKKIIAMTPPLGDFRDPQLRFSQRQSYELF